jgi:hypothetical protein
MNSFPSRHGGRLRALMLAAMMLVSGVLDASAQRVKKSPADALVDALLWAVPDTIDLSPYPSDVRAELEAMFRRVRDYKSPRVAPPTEGVRLMVHSAFVGYERRLVAHSDAPDVRAIAVDYVNRLKPCYEWEGYHDCPEHEARFATEYLASHPTAPFREFLPLLIAHRWLCTAEAYDYEKRPADATRSRRAYEEAIARARQSPALLIRTAADGLHARGRCVV